MAVFFDGFLCGFHSLLKATMELSSRSIPMASTVEKLLSDNVAGDIVDRA